MMFEGFGERIVRGICGMLFWPEGVYVSMLGADLGIAGVGLVTGMSRRGEGKKMRVCRIIFLVSWDMDSG